MEAVFLIKELKRYEFANEVNVNYKYVNPRVVRKIHQMEKKINIWTVNESKNLEKYVKMGVDGIITDFPRSLERYNRIINWIYS